MSRPVQCDLCRSPFQGQRGELCSDCSNVEREFPKLFKWIRGVIETRLQVEMDEHEERYAHDYRDMD